jgi:hypothetical protein
MRRIIEKLLNRWPQPECPAAWVSSVTQFRRLDGEKFPLPGTMNQLVAKSGSKYAETAVTMAQKKA